MPETRGTVAKMNPTMEEEEGADNTNNSADMNPSPVAEVSPDLKKQTVVITNQVNETGTEKGGNDASQLKPNEKPTGGSNKLGDKKKKGRKGGKKASKAAETALSMDDGVADLKPAAKRKVVNKKQAAKKSTKPQAVKPAGKLSKAAKTASPNKQGSKVAAIKPRGKAGRVKPAKTLAVAKAARLPVKAKDAKKSAKDAKICAKKAAKSLKAGGFSKKTIPMKPIQVKKQGNLVNLMLTRCGLALFTFVKSSNQLMMAYMAAFFDAIQNNTALQAELKTIGLFPIRVDLTSNNTKTFTVGSYDIPELQLACIVGRDASPKAIQSLWKKVAAAADSHTSTVTAKNKYTTRTHIGEDKTPRSGPVPLDVCFIDADTIPVIQMGYPDNDLQEVAQDAVVLVEYFTDPNHGRNVIMSHVAGVPFEYYEEKEDSDDNDDDTDDDGEETSDEDSDEESDSDDYEQEDDHDDDMLDEGDNNEGEDDGDDDDGDGDDDEVEDDEEEDEDEE